METNTKQKEILVMINTSFAQREWCEKSWENKNFTQQERLEEACINGLVQQMLPEIFNAPGAHKLYLWQMKAGFSFIQLELGEFPLAQEKNFSIDPHNFLAVTWYN